MGTWTGLADKTEPQESTPESSTAVAPSSTDKPARAPMARLGSLSGWGFGGKNTEAVLEEDDEADDRRIRFTIGGGAGRRLTKEDFLKEIQSLDPKARCEIVEESDAPAVMKAMARQDASSESAGSNRLLGARSAQLTSGKGTAKVVGAELAKRKGSKIDEEEEEESSQDEREKESRRRGARANTRRQPNPDSSTDAPESAVERKRREKAMRGIDDDASPSHRGRAPAREESVEEPSGETAAEKRRREAALGVGGSQDDSDDDDTPRVPPPVAKSRGIRFAQSPVRGKR